MVVVSFWPIFASGIAAVAISFLWYHPKVFGTYWMRATGITPEQAERGKKRMPISLFGGFLSAMLVAWVMNYMGIVFGIIDWPGAVFDLALWVWLGFVAPPMFGMVLWEQKPFRLYLINAGYWLVVLVVTALILLFGSQVSGPTADEGIPADQATAVAD